MRLCFCLCGLLLISLCFADCYKFSGTVLNSSPGLLALQVENARQVAIQFDDLKYNPRIPKGVLVVGYAEGENGAWRSNKYSIDIPSRNVANYKLYLEKAELKDKSKCLKNSQN